MKTKPSVQKQLEIELFDAFWNDPVFNRQLDRRFDELMGGRSEEECSDEEFDVMTDGSLTHAEKLEALSELRTPRACRVIECRRSPD